MMTNAPKIVVSTTLEHPDWGPTTLISSDVAAELTKLKQQPGRNISIGASGTLIRFLLQQGLLDELTLLVHPVVVGAGKHLFEGGTGQVPLKLLESRSLSTGVVALRYAPAS
jgi:dihydrofolate reductase